MKSDGIDFVVPWVDSSDPNWRKSYEEHAHKNSLFIDKSEKRYRDWGLFKYWFRGIEKFAPWVRKVHLVTSGHYPEWLNKEHPKINLVKHEDYIPKEFLPTFSSHPIELNLHRIKGLSEKFVYFNDDFFLINHCNQENFFKAGLPLDSAILTAYDGVGFNRILVNNISIINRHFNKNTSIKNNIFKWYNYKYGANLIRNILLLPWSNFTGIYDHHLPNSFLKETFIEIWSEEKEVLKKICANKFRNTNEDVNQYLMRFWQIASGNFKPYPKQKLGDYFRIGIDSLDNVLITMEKSKKPIIVLNDHDPDDLDEVILKLKKAFKMKFPAKSEFEL